MSLRQDQVDTLLRPIRPHRVLKDRDGMSHVAAYDVIAHMNRVFGFGNWDTDVVRLELIREHSDTVTKNGKDRVGWWVTYLCVLRLTVRDPHGVEVCHYEDSATGSAQNMPFFGDAHDFAVKNAVSYAIKRCAKNFGDQFGLALYGKGQTDALVGRTLVMPGASGESTHDVEEHAPAAVSLGNDEREHPTAAKAAQAEGIPLNAVRMTDPQAVRFLELADQTPAVDPDAPPAVPG